MKLHVLCNYDSGRQEVAYRSEMDANMAQNLLWRDNVAHTNVIEMDERDVTCEVLGDPHSPASDPWYRLPVADIRWWSVAVWTLVCVGIGIEIGRWL